MSIRETILSTLVSTLSAAPSVGAPVYRSRVTPLSRGETPAIVVEPVQDSANQVVIPKLDWSLLVRVSVIVRGDVPDQVGDSIVAAVHSKMMQDLTLSGLCYDIQPQSTSFELIDADNSAGVISSDFLVLYRTSLTDISLV